MDAKTIQSLLNGSGFPCGAIDGDIGEKTRAAVRLFQQAHAFSSILIDGDPGPQTQNALALLPRLSEHFAWNEVMCHHCGRAYVRRELLFGLEILRAHVGPVVLEDAYRCPVHNAEVGGASDSMHIFGAAADLKNMPALNTVKSLHVFSGVGNRGNLASHVDVRHVMGTINRTPNAIPSNPATWDYPG